MPIAYYIKKPKVYQVEEYDYKRKLDLIKITPYPDLLGRSDDLCIKCGLLIYKHGYIPELNKYVCPGDLIVKSPDNQISIFKPDVFHRQFTRIKDE